MYKPQLALPVAFRRRVAWEVEPVEYFGQTAHFWLSEEWIPITLSKAGFNLIPAHPYTTLPYHALMP